MTKPRETGDPEGVDRDREAETRRRDQPRPRRLPEGLWMDPDEPEAIEGEEAPKGAG